MDKIIDLIKSIADRYGIKWLVALGGIAAIWHLDMSEKLTTPAAAAIVVIIIVFFTFRLFERRSNGSEQRSPKAGTQ